MKRTFIRFFLTVVAMTVVLSLTAGAAEIFRFSHEIDATQNGGPDGGYWAKDPVTTVEKSAKRGVVLNNPNDSRILWAFTNAQVEKTPYFCFELPENSGIFKVTISKHWDVEREVELEFKDGLNVFDVMKLLENQTTIGYTYFVFYFTGGAPATVNELCLSSVDPRTRGGDDNPVTGDALPAAIVAAAACAAAVFAKKR